jgi:hypothetical protein
MELPDTEEPEGSQDEQVEIYSKRAIRGFSIFFSTIFGGVLLFINLRKAGYKQEANTVLAFAIGYTFLSSFLVGIIGATSITSLLFNLAGGMILSDYFFPKYFPEDDYYPKPIWGALGVSLIISISLFSILYFNGQLPEVTKMLSK